MNTLHYASPLILTGLAIAITFKANLYNMGVEGQMLLRRILCRNHRSISQYFKSIFKQTDLFSGCNCLWNGVRIDSGTSEGKMQCK